MIPRRLLSVLLFILTLTNVHALFGKDKEGKQEKSQAEMEEEAMRTVQTGFHGLKAAAKDPNMLADVMQSFQDPEIVAEAKKMMADPHFQAQMKKFTEDPSFKQSMEKAKEMLQDPAAMEQMGKQVEAMLTGANDMRREDADTLRARSRNSAMKEMTGETDMGGQARLGLEALKSASPDIMREAMAQMQDPEIMREVQKMVKDPAFAAQVKEMAKTPEFQEAMQRSASMVKGMMGSEQAA